MQSSRADPDKPFRPISSFDETIVLSHIAADSVGGILLGRIQCPRRGANPPGVQIQCLEVRSEIRQTSISSLEARALLLEQFRAHSDGLFFRSSFPAGSGYRISPESHIFADLSVHASDLLSSYDHGYFLLFDCIPVQIHEI
jgi:hypothetical protein